jgi:endo-1,4-beta-xylanase
MPRRFCHVALLIPLLFVPAFAFTGGTTPPEIPLWANGAPGFEDRKDEKEGKNVQGMGDIICTNIHNPSITPYLPPKDKATGAAVVIAPGGGHNSLWIVHEGYNVGDWLSQRGVAAFVLKYRLAREKGSPYKIEVHALQDGQRAIRLIRSRAQEWGIDPQRVGILGFSAGGEVVAYACTRFDKGKDDAADPVERQSCRPDFQALIYPGPLGIRGATLTADVPPAFIAIGETDSQQATLANHYLALRKAKVSAELHVYAKTGHGFGLRPSDTRPAAAWPQRFLEWLGSQGFLKKS